ncbi:MAG: alpha-glucosidase [Chloroflexota bacterium]
MTELKWWQKAVFYQIYPRSFADGNGDGIGDFIGMAAKLDHLVDLGVDAIWISPHFPSPQFDVGYDISDYVNVAPEYGTLEDFKKFLDGAHERGLKVILDLVLNHTSHLHQWFIDSRSDRNHPKRDWYIWRDGKNGGPPNNWMSPFGGSAWEYDDTTGQYYYHFFLKEQPDLNWRNPEVKQAMWDAVRFWLDLGVDGYRLDAIGTIFEDPSLADHTSKLSQDDLRRRLKHGFPYEGDQELLDAWDAMYKLQVEQPGVHELMQDLRRVLDEYDERILVGENDDVSYYGDGSNELQMAFNFPLMKTSRLTPKWIRANQKERLSLLPPGAWPCNTLNNHDASRVYSRYSDGVNTDAIARTSVALMLTMWGTPFLYNGEEIGMSDYRLTDISQFRDPPAVWFYNHELEEGTPPEKALDLAADYSRDRCRTPMQWDGSPNAGFSPAEVATWLPLNPNYRQGVNVADQQSDPGSMLNHYKRLLRLRRETPALVDGGYTAVNENAEEYFAFLRKSADGKQTCLVTLNLSAKAVQANFDLAGYTQARCLFSTHKPEGSALELQGLHLEAFEVLVTELIS